MNAQAENWNNYWQGRVGTDAGAAGVGIENDPELAAFWDAELALCDAAAPLLDLACGAGSVARRALTAGFKDVTGADISSEAIAALKTSFPDVKGVVCPADQTGFADDSFPVVMSQFGFEYAGAVRCAPEIARILAPQGRFTALVHMAGSAVEQEVLYNKRQAQSVLETGFVEAAKDLFLADRQTANGAPDNAAFARALAAFRPAQNALKMLADDQGGLAAHLYEGTQTLYNRRRAYALPDIHGWLDGMSAEIKAYIGRMDSMSEAALDDAAVQTTVKALTEAGLNVSETEPLISAGDTLGLILRAVKSV